jgi:L-malate glycosyltransferase
VYYHPNQVECQQMPHILQMIDALKVGGAEQMLIIFAENLPADAGKLTIVTFRVKATHMQAQLEQLGAQVVIIEGKTLLDPRRLWRLYRFLRQSKPDVIHAHLTTAIILGSFMGRLLKIPVVCTLHNTQLKSKNPIRLWFHRQALKRANKVLAVGYKVADSFRDEINPQPIEVMLNAVTPMPPFPPEAQQTLRQSVVGNFTGRILICVGRLVKAKGHADLLTAYAQIIAEFPDTRLLLVGDGVLRPDLEAFIREHHLEKHVHLLGLRQDVPALLALSDIFVSASHWEGLPIAVLEAMASGLPVVGTDVGDVGHVVVEGTGIIVPPHTPDQFATALRTLLSDPTKLDTYGANAKRHIETTYNAQTWVQKLIDIYQGLSN